MGGDSSVGQFVWVDLASHGMDEAVTWLCELFGWELDRVDSHGPSRYGHFALGGETVAGIGEMTEEMKQGAPPHWNNYVGVADCAATVARARQLGAEILWDTQEVGDGDGKLAVLKDPTGAIVSLWEGGAHAHSARGNEPGRFCWQELATRDLAAARAFYSELFGWTLAASEGPAPTPMLAVQSGGEDIAHVIEMNEQWGEMPPHWSVYFSVADTDATCEKAGATGGQVLVPPFDIPPGRIAVIAGPHGAPFYVIALNR